MSRVQAILEKVDELKKKVENDSEAIEQLSDEEIEQLAGGIMSAGNGTCPTTPINGVCPKE